MDEATRETPKNTTGFFLEVSQLGKETKTRNQGTKEPTPNPGQPSSAAGRRMGDVGWGMERDVLTPQRRQVRYPMSELARPR